ncbi:hypothetical protein [Streptomyces marokkonensis]|uniref:hypothetical protein n=1 Tax=Streptomyces marokkonensis TaxID=324855 RepID=UPI001FCCB016|nr:hypothetical protein [Streptomyces marokkonensis]
MGGAFVQACLEVTGLGLRERAGIAFVGERQGVLVAQPFQFGSQSRRRLVGSRVRVGPGCRVIDALLFL